MLKDIFKIWRLYSFETMLNEFEDRQQILFGEMFTSNTIQKLKKSDFFSQVKEKILNGNSVRDLNNKYQGESLNPYVKMTREFRNSVSKSFKYTPVIFCLNLMKRLIDAENVLKKKKKWSNQYWGFLNRAYAHFASFIRDYDSNEKLNEKLEYFLIFQKIYEDIDITIS